jgi:pimeloyl-ACP methyl ester carboxylesterase
VPPVNPLVELHLPGNWPKLSAASIFFASIVARSVYGLNPTMPQRAMEWAGTLAGYQRFGPQDAMPPGGALGFLADRMLVAVHGTRGNQALVDQVLPVLALAQISHATPPFRCHPVWLSAGQAWANRIRGPWEAAGRPPLDLFGHSLGAAVVAVAYALLAPTGPRPHDRLWLFGSPVFGTASLNRLLNPVRIISLAAPGDPMIHLPPPAWVYSASRLTGGFFHQDYEDYTPSRAYMEIATPQGVRPLNRSFFDGMSLVNRMIQVGGQLADFEKHYMRNYTRLLQNNLLDSLQEARIPLTGYAPLFALRAEMDVLNL